MVDKLEALAQEVRTVIIALDAIAANPVRDFGDGYKRVGVNFSIEACEYASDITGYDRTFCKMLNHRFRMDAAELMFERALAEVA